MTSHDQKRLVELVKKALSELSGVRASLDPKSISEDEAAPDAQRKTNIQADDTSDSVPPTFSPSSPQIAPNHYSITCKTEKDWWDKAKPFVEIAGVALLFIYTLYTIKMYCANKEAAEAAKSSADTAKATLTASDRPWLAPQIDLAGPFYFSPDGDGHISIRYRVSNTGHSPATDVGHSDIMIVSVDPEREPNSVRDSSCKKAEQASPSSGTAIFPDKDYRTGIVVMSVSRADIANATRYIKTIMPKIITCVAYHSPIDTKTWFHTGEIYDLDIRLGDDGAAAMTITPGVNVPLEKLQLRFSVFHGVIAN